MANSTQSTAELCTKVKATEIVKTFRRLKRERNTWEKMAQQFKQALEEAFDQRDQFRDLLIATQAELENVKMQYRVPSQPTSDPSTNDQVMWLSTGDWLSTAFTREHLDDAEELLAEGEYAKALSSIDDLLHSPISPEVQAEATLLKSVVLRCSRRPSDALAQCDEVLDMWNRNASLRQFHNLREKANFYKGICLFELQDFTRARIAFTPIDSAEHFATRAKEWRDRCVEEQRRIIEVNAIRMEAAKAEKDATRAEARYILNSIKHGDPWDYDSVVAAYSAPSKKLDGSTIVPGVDQDELDYSMFLDPLGIRRPKEMVPGDLYSEGNSYIQPSKSSPSTFSLAQPAVLSSTETAQCPFIEAQQEPLHNATDDEPETFPGADALKDEPSPYLMAFRPHESRNVRAWEPMGRGGP